MAGLRKKKGVKLPLPFHHHKKFEAMPTIKFEEPFMDEAEANLARNIEALIGQVTTHDCRTLAPVVRTICQACGVDMMVGSGGSHVYIHRFNQFVAGDHTNPSNIRWAIITDN